MHLKSIEHCELENKRVCLRVDFNVPMRNGEILNDARLRAALPSIQFALQAKARIFLLSHLGRPPVGSSEAKYSLEPVAKRLQQLLQHPVRFVKKWLSGFPISPGEIVLCENVRLNKGEKENSPTLAEKMAALADVFIFDAFACAHRTEASTTGMARLIAQRAVGFLVMAEVSALEQALQSSQEPVIAVVGGAKVSDKFQVLTFLLDKVNTLIVGGGMANTFLSAQGYAIGRSLAEPELAEAIKVFIKQAAEKGVALILPQDVVVAQEISPKSEAHTCRLENIGEEDRILDIGPKTCEYYATLMEKAKTIIWNGPLGVFEMPIFAHGTKRLALAIAKSSAFSLAGGGETVAAIEQYGVREQISYISTGGGAFLEFLEGRELPALGLYSK